jgi:glyoxylase-like metal-dependent hydrolase (beta-lactamase superfamily II)
MSLEQPLCWYADESALCFYLLNVGEGLMTLIIFPDSTVMLFDCNVTTDNEDDIIAFLDKVIPEEYNVDKEEYEKPIHIFVNSHRDEDHYRGLKKVNERFPIKSIWDSGQTGATTNSTEDIRLSVAPPGYTNYCPLFSSLVVVGHIGGFGIIDCNLGNSVIIYINLFFAAILGIAEVVIIFLAPVECWNRENDTSPASKSSPDS